MSIEKDAERYRKLQRYMGSNVKEGWDIVCQLGGVASWVGWDDMDQYLDDLPECNVGLCERPMQELTELNQELGLYDEEKS